MYFIEEESFRVDWTPPVDYAVANNPSAFTLDLLLGSDN
jgi:hypothetical protein